jgi:hypothetical protein
LLLIVVMAPAVWRVYRLTAFWPVLWIAGYFVALWLWIPKDTHYQTAYVAIPTSLLVALAVDVATRDRKGGREFVGSRLAFFAPLVWCAAMCWGAGLLLIYPTVALSQWNARSHASLERDVAKVVPAGATVLVDPSAYFACLRNGCNVYYRQCLYRGGRDDPAERERYESRLYSEFGGEFVIIDAGSRLPSDNVLKGRAISRVAVIGMSKTPFFLANDPPYFFEVYKVVHQ